MPSPPPTGGLAYRLELASWVASRPPGLALLEITAEHFYRVGSAPLRHLAASHSLIVQTSRLSLGTPGPLDASELEAFERVVTAADPLWICERLAFRRGGGLDLGKPQPVPLTTETLGRFIEHGREVMARSRKRLLLGNVASHVRIRGSIDAPEFLNRFCAESGGGGGQPRALGAGGLQRPPRQAAGSQPAGGGAGDVPGRMMQAGRGSAARNGRSAARTFGTRCAGLEPSRNTTGRLALRRTGPRGPPGRGDYSATTLLAAGPFGPWTTSNSTRWPSVRDL